MEIRIVREPVTDEELRALAAIEYFSLINIRPAQGNRGQEVESSDIRNAIRTLARCVAPNLEL